MIGYDSKLPEFLPLWARSNGTDLLSEDGRTAQLDDPAVVEALEFAVGIYKAQGGFSAVKAYRDSADFFGEGNQSATNVLGAMPMENWYVNVLNEVSGRAHGLRHLEQIREEFIPDDAPAPWGDAIDAMYEANENTFSYPANPADAEFKTAWQDAVNRVLNGQAEPQESLEQAQEQAQTALDKAWAEWGTEQD